MSNHDPDEMSRIIASSNPRLGGPRGRARWTTTPAPTTFTANPMSTELAPKPVRAKFLGGPRHGQTRQLAPDPPKVITAPSPEGTHAYEQSSFDRALARPRRRSAIYRAQDGCS